MKEHLFSTNVHPMLSDISAHLQRALITVASGRRIPAIEFLEFKANLMKFS